MPSYKVCFIIQRRVPMSSYKITWRIGVASLSDPEFLRQFIELTKKDGNASDEVWLTIATPNTYCYEPLTTIAHKCEAFMAPAAALRKEGMRVGINPWPTFGAEESYQVDKNRREMPFQPMVDKNGKVARRVACPISPEFLGYTRERFMLFARTGCDFVWVEDDCRFTHLGQLSYPCFCPRCVKGFENGMFADRESLVAALDDPQNEELRRKWSAYTGDRLALYCKTVRDAVDEVDPSIGTPLMTVGYSHTTYAGNYIEKCCKALRAEALRPGHGFYYDVDPMGMLDKAIEHSRQVIDAPASVQNDVQYEEESAPRTPFNKAPDTRFMEMALSIWGGCTGIAMNHLLPQGGPRPFDHLAYEMKRLKECHHFFDRYLSFAHDLPQSGIWAAYTPWKMAGMKVGEKGWFAEHNPAYAADKFVREWPAFGIPTTCDPRGAYATLIQGKIAEVLTDEELTRIFQKGVFLDGEALKALWERGWGEKTGVKCPFSLFGGSETLADTPYAGDFAGAAHSSVSGVAYDLEPVRDGVETLAYITRFDAPRQPCVTKYGNVVVLGYDPYNHTGTPGRLLMMRNLQKEMGASVILEPIDVYDSPRVSVWVRADEKRAAVLLINSQIASARAFDVCFRGSAFAASMLDMDTDISVPVRHEDGFARVRIDGMTPWEMKLILFE